MALENRCRKFSQDFSETHICSCKALLVTRGNSAMCDENITTLTAHYIENILNIISSLVLRIIPFFLLLFCFIVFFILNAEIFR